MRRNTQEIMSLLQVSEDQANLVEARMGENGIDFSECTMREFRQLARVASMQLDAERQRQPRVSGERPSANFKRRGERHATPASVQPTKSALIVSAEGSIVKVVAESIEYTLSCNGSLHAKLIAQALSDGLVDIDSNPI